MTEPLSEKKRKIKLADPETEWKKLETKPKYFSCFFGGQ